MSSARKSKCRTWHVGRETAMPLPTLPLADTVDTADTLGRSRRCIRLESVRARGVLTELSPAFGLSSHDRPVDFRSLNKPRAAQQD